jgi:hypothetical protein
MLVYPIVGQGKLRGVISLIMLKMNTILVIIIIIIIIIIY